MPELTNTFMEVFDIRKTSELGLKLPEIVGGKPEIIVCEKSPDQELQVEEGMKQAEAIESGAVDRKEDNMLAVCTYMTKVALDARIIDPEAEDYEGCYFYSISALTGAASVRVKLPQIAQKMGVNHKDNVIRLINKLVNYGYVTKRKIKNSFTLFPVVNEYTLTNPNPKDCILVPDYFLDIYVD